jgi:hypothetical protein
MTSSAQTIITLESNTLTEAPQTAVLKQTFVFLGGESDMPTAAWGEINGNITDQADLQEALAAKVNTADLGSAANSDVGDFDAAGSAAAAETAAKAYTDTQIGDLGSAAHHAAEDFDASGAAAAAQANAKAYTDALAAELGTAAGHSAGDFDPAGAAATAQAAAEAYTDAVQASAEAYTDTKIGALGSASTHAATDFADAAATTAALGLKADLNSPHMTGNPLAPTPVTSDNSTAIATTAFVQAVVATVINGSPGALDTLKELADALGDDANFAATVTTALAGKQPLSAILTALAAQANVANTLAYFTGSGMATTAFSAVGQTLVGLANAAAIRASLAVPGTGTANTYTKAQSVTPVANNAATGATATDASASNHFEYKLIGNITLSNPTNVVRGTELIFALLQDGTGNRTVTLGSNFVLHTGDAFSTAANAVDILRCYCHSNGKIYARI